jgi:hypothetical protein
MGGGSPRWNDVLKPLPRPVSEGSVLIRKELRLFCQILYVYHQKFRLLYDDCPGAPPNAQPATLTVSKYHLSSSTLFHVRLCVIHL